MRTRGELAERYPTNWELAGARAALVVRHLQADGVDPASMRAISAGDYHPVASNDTAEGRAQNRRTDIVLRPTAQQGQQERRPGEANAPTATIASGVRS